MPFFLKILLVTLVGTGLGLIATEAAVERGFLFGRVAQGPWAAWPSTGSSAIDPYARAVVARAGLAPLGADEGVAFTARTDEDGRPLDAACDYAIEGADPASRYWSLALFDRRGDVVANDLDRYALTSQQVLRLDGRVRVTVSRSVQPGNWLPAPKSGRFVLVLFLYETGFGALTSATDAKLFALRRTACS